MSKIGINWDTLEYETRKSLVITISRVYSRFSPLLLLNFLSALSTMECSLQKIEKIGSDFELISEEYSEEHSLINSNQPAQNLNCDENDSVVSIENDKNYDSLTNENVIDDNYNNLAPTKNNENKTRKIPDFKFKSFYRNDLFEIINKYVCVGSYTNWELTELFSSLSLLGE